MPIIRTGLVEICIYKIIDGEPKYLLLKRAEKDTLHPGIWQIVTGMLNGDEHTIDAARREVYEETKLNLNRFWVVPLVDWFYSPADDIMFVGPFFAGEVAESAEPVLSEEHEHFKWVPMSDVAKHIPWPNQIKCVEIIHGFIKSGMNSSTLIEI